MTTDQDTRCPDIADPESQGSRIMERLGDFLDDEIIPMAEFESDIIDSVASLLVGFLARSQHSEQEAQEVLDRIARTWPDTRRQILALDALDDEVATQ